MRRTPGKLNLYLTVGERRDSDGRHLIRTVFYPFWRVVDTVEVGRSTPGSGLSIRTTGREIPGEESDNLALRAVDGYCGRLGIQPDFEIRLHKAIPVAAGMGGGSSDAAAALLEVNRLEKRASEEELQEIAALLGADVPFFLNPVPSLATGVGDILEPLESFPELNLLVIYPGVHSPVAWAYQNWRRPDGLRPPEWPPPKDCDWGGFLWNDLGFAVAERYPEVRNALDDITSCGARSCIVSGSGSAVFGVFDGAEELEAARRRLSIAWEVF